MNILSEVLSNIGFDSKVIAFGTELQKKISSSEVQKAFLENLHIAGYFHDNAVRNAVSLIRRQNNDGHDSFEKMMEILNMCGANEKHPQKFNANILFEKFSHHGHFLNETDLKNIIVFLGRKAFGRVASQERNELSSHLWAEANGDRYLENAKKLGLILEEKPRLKKYHETWIQGAAYHRMKRRVVYTKKLYDEGFDLGVIRLLSGEREIWLEIDCLTISEVERIAKKHNIKIIGFEEKEFLGSKRTYPKYAKGEDRKITEALLAKEVYQEVFGADLIDEFVIDAKVENDSSRVTTFSVTSDFIKSQFAQRILRGDFGENEINILIVTNQPFVERQTLTNERAAVKEFRKLGIERKINFDGTGESSIAPITEIHSEFGALVSEKYMRQVELDRLHMIKILKKIKLR